MTTRAQRAKEKKDLFDYIISDVFDLDSADLLVQALDGFGVTSIEHLLSMQE